MKGLRTNGNRPHGLGIGQRGCGVELVRDMGVRTTGSGVGTWWEWTLCGETAGGCWRSCSDKSTA